MGRKFNKKTAVREISSKKLLLIAAIIAVTAIIAASIFILSILRRKPVAAFYGLSESTQKAISSELADFTIMTYNASKPLAAQLKYGKKADILFTSGGKAVSDAVPTTEKNKAALPHTVLDGMISSARMSAPLNTEGAVLAVPVLINNYEIDINRPLMRNSGYASLDSWADIDKFARSMHGKITAPVIMAGGDDRELINITGALCEALQGKAAWDNIVSKIKESVAAGKDTEMDFETVLSDLCSTQESPLYMTDRMLSSWYKDGILYPETFHMKTSDVKSFMESELCAISFLTLTQHRAVAPGSINNYDSQYYPSSPDASARNFTSPLLFIIPLRKNKQGTDIIKAFAKDRQEKISRATGLAPVQADSRVPDRQADDVRYWVAASGAPLPALADAAFSDDSVRADFAQALRTQIKYK
ncbi:MAG: hypothetical protein M0P01_03820 [Treponema sp.]|nr:hypothetical protein [Treponema sp.]